MQPYAARHIYTSTLSLVCECPLLSKRISWSQLFHSWSFHYRSHSSKISMLHFHWITCGSSHFFSDSTRNKLPCMFKVCHKLLRTSNMHPTTLVHASTSLWFGRIFLKKLFCQVCQIRHQCKRAAGSLQAVLALHDARARRGSSRHVRTSSGVIARSDGTFSN